MSDLAVSDKRLLLRHLLQSLVQRGTQVVLPVGCNGFNEDWLLDSLDVPKLLSLADSKSNIDLISLCKSRTGHINIETNFSSLKLVYTEDADPDQIIKDRTPLPKLHNTSSTWLEDSDEQPFQQLAFLIFLQSCGPHSSDSLLQSLRSHLEITETAGLELSKVVSLATQNGITSFATINSIVRLLQIIPPSAFQSFRSYSSWRSAMSSILLGCIEDKVSTSWISSSSSSPTHAATTTDNGRYLLATLKGNIRRLDVRDSDEFNATEHTAATSAIADATQQLLANCSTGVAFPWAARVKLAELLLQGIFDTLDEGSYSDDAENLLRSLQSIVWKALEMTLVAHQALYVWVHFRQYILSQHVVLLESSITMLKQMTLDQTSTDDDTSTNTTTAASHLNDVCAVDLSRNVLVALKRECIGALSDYHRLKGGIPEIRSLLSLLENVDSVLQGKDSSGTTRTRSTRSTTTLTNTKGVDTIGNTHRHADVDVDVLLQQCIAMSVRANFERKVIEFEKNVSVEEDRVALLATGTKEMLRLECNEYCFVFLPLQPAAKSIAAATLHQLFGSKLLPWLITVTSLTKSVVATVRASLSLEQDLLLEANASPSSLNNQQTPTPRISPYNAMEKVTPLLYTWAQSQLSVLQEWLNRILGKEDWLVVTKSQGGSARSASEAAKVASDVIDALFGMDIEIPSGVVRCLVEGIDGILQKYCEAVLFGLGNPDSLIPPAPPLTRYKQDIAIQAELNELHDTTNASSFASHNTKSGLLPLSAGSPHKNTAGGSTSGMLSSSAASSSKGNKLKAMTSKVNSVFTAQWLPPPTSEEQQHILATAFPLLIVRANSLHRLVQSVLKLEKIIVQKWDARRLDMLGHAGGDEKKSSLKDAFEWVSGMFDGTKGAAARGIDRILYFCAVKLICGDLRYAIFERLYKFHVETARLQPILEHIDTSLGTLCETLHEDLTARLAGHICKTLSAAITHVLLDGGPYRLFTQQDAELLEGDVEQLRIVFHADGAGLDPGAICQLSQPLTDVIAIMALDTKALIAAMTTARKQPLGSIDTKNSIDPDIVLRVLCHRADHAASKYLKKEYKIGKKLPIGLVLSVSKSFHSLVNGHGGGGGGGRVVGMSRVATVTP